MAGANRVHLARRHTHYYLYMPKTTQIPPNKWQFWHNGPQISMRHTSNLFQERNLCVCANAASAELLVKMMNNHFKHTPEDCQDLVDSISSSNNPFHAHEFDIALLDGFMGCECGETIEETITRRNGQ